MPITNERKIVYDVYDNYNEDVMFRVECTEAQKQMIESIFLAIYNYNQTDYSIVLPECNIPIIKL